MFYSFPQRFQQVRPSSVLEMHPVPATLPWKKIGVDLITMLRSSSDGWCYILSLRDYFTKYVFAVSLKDKKAISFAE